MNDTEYRALVDTYAKQQAGLITSLLRLLLGMWVPFTWAHRPDLVNAWAARSAVDVDIAAAQARRIARAFAIEQLRALDALPDRLPPIEDDYARSGTPIVEVYKRPARQYEHAVRKGKTEQEAAAAFTERMEKIVKADLTTVARDEIVRVAKAAKKVVGYRRVLHPEKSEHGPCGLCIVAADRLYSMDDLLPLHNGCVCSFGIEVYEDGTSPEEHSPWVRLNKADLETIYKAAGSMYATDLQRIRVGVKEHGELGPILVRDGDEFKTWDRATAEAKRQKFTPYKPPAKAETVQQWGGMVATSERSIQILEDARRNGTNLVDMAGLGRITAVRDIDKAIEYHRALIARAKAHAA